MTDAPPPYVGIYGPSTGPYAGASGQPPPGKQFQNGNNQEILNWDRVIVVKKYLRIL